MGAVSHGVRGEHRVRRHRPTAHTIHRPRGGRLWRSDGPELGGWLTTSSRDDPWLATHPLPTLRITLSLTLIDPDLVFRELHILVAIEKK